jgi:DNA-binding MarR family transcriptional regulator
MADEIDSIEWSRRSWAGKGGPEPEYFAAMVAVLRLSQLVGATIDRALRDHGVNRTGFLILAVLFLKSDRSLSMGQLSKRLLLHPTTVSLVADKLQERNLVLRSSSTTDRRTILATLTDEGAQTLMAIGEQLGEARYGFDDVDPRMAVTLTEIVRHVRHDMGDS